MSESINKELIEVVQAFLDFAPSNGNRCMYCEMSVYGSNDTDEHSPDCEMAKGYAAVMKANTAADQAAIRLQRAVELCAIIEELQRVANRAGKQLGLAGDEPHPLNIIDNALFGTLMVAKTAVGKLPKVDEEGNPIKP